MLDNELQLFDKEALFFRLYEALNRSEKEVIFVVGAPLTAPLDGARGVADVGAVVELIRSEFPERSRHRERFDTAVAESHNPYQAAFDFLSGNAGQDAANRIIRQAVAHALKPSGSDDWRSVVAKLGDDALKALDLDTAIWQLTPGVIALGTLVARFPGRFGKILVTSNFDPLVEVSVRRSGGSAWRTSLPVDGSIRQSDAEGCQVIHIHGYWYGSDTLHTSRQLLHSRPTLKNDLLTLLQNKIVVVMAYGGWPDIFTGALGGIVSNDNLFPEILWTFYSDHPSLSEHLRVTLQPGVDRNRVTFYRGIDCHEFLPELLSLWEANPGAETTNVGNLTGKKVGSAAAPGNKARLFRLAPLECDRPPSIEVWVGREDELRALEASKAKVVVICGMGGEGKSALASRYIGSLDEQESGYRLWDWRDCKEQSDRIRTQIVEIIVRFSEGRVLADDLAKASDIELVEVLIDQTSDARAVLVFDNVDSYVDLENRSFIGLLDTLVQRISTSESTSRVVLTCRPDVQYPSSSVITFPMKGISAEETIELFAKRASAVTIPEEDIREAHDRTNGHAFRLDLLAVQVTKVPGTTLRKLLNDMRRGRDDSPDILSPLWDKLLPREQTLLRFMAEAVRPETADMIEGLVASQLNYQKFSKALRSLIALNLIVVKPEIDAPDLYDLHPLVRQFVRSKFERAERSGFIRVVINQYELIIRTVEALLGVNMPYSMLERWSQKAELQIAAGLFKEAFETLAKIGNAFIGGGHVQEYVRVGRLLFEAIDWETAPTKHSQFDNIVGTMVEALDQLGDTESADSLLRRYEATIPQKTVRYINFCNVRAYSYWMRGDFEQAAEWAQKGVMLKFETNVDTQFDCGHTLALAQRDAGQPEVALDYFRKDHEVADILAGIASIPPDGAMHGNVGRCFHLMGRLDEALTCYRKSLKILEAETLSTTKSNRAYGRRWVGQIFAIFGDTEKAEAFLLDAIRVLGSSSPVRVRELYADVERILEGDVSVMQEAKATRIVNNWMSD
ncbi:tetratricopeptide repeat protein [Labrys sp. KNU-23]|uniref:tetratricopeptide repeat protein n=1 Tax=Labrys sp. KNU-23 TaxID=2789216 RepID=UPI0011EBBA21|nr:tetratricopeptide repeat protein [Labrys sp. KNU-23]QEN87877.1 tetratricopeptide repeat protein [Labrys sp. KNU-23]